MKAASFVLTVNIGHILVLRRKTCALLRAKTSALLRRKTCAVLIARTCALFRATTKETTEGGGEGRRLCIGSEQSTCLSSQHSSGGCHQLVQGGVGAKRGFRSPTGRTTEGGQGEQQNLTRLMTPRGRRIWGGWLQFSFSFRNEVVCTHLLHPLSERVSPHTPCGLHLGQVSS